MGTEITNMGFQTALTTEHVVVIGQVPSSELWWQLTNKKED